MIPAFHEQRPYDGLECYNSVLVLAFSLGFASWLPHLFLVDDDKPPRLDHRQYTAAIFWYFVVTTTVCGLLLAVAPVLPFLDGYDLNTMLRLARSHGDDVTGPIWLVGPTLWAISATLLYRTTRGVWRRHRRTR